MDTRKLSRRQIMRTLGIGAGLTLIAPIVAACGQSGGTAPAKPSASSPEDPRYE